MKRALVALFATSTLAVGANLPAYLVIIKSTIQYRRVAGIASWCEYEGINCQSLFTIYVMLILLHVYSDTMHTRWLCLVQSTQSSKWRGVLVGRDTISRARSVMHACT